MSSVLGHETLEQLFLSARSQNAWQDRDIPDDTLRKLFDIVKMGPTSANCSPARYVFVKSDEGKERLRPHLSEGNTAKTMTAPVCVIVAYDLEFYEHLPRLFPHTDAKSWFTSSADLARETAFRNGTLQGGYLILAARALGLDAGPMSGFDQKGVDQEFFAGTQVKSNFLVNLGYGDPSALFGRSPRFDFEDVAQII
ncbi:MAG: malonic semialdehyde reductase [Alphaproteobacteria bacterium]|nr:malonic semialdehyde reductase [Alphaproteobacteria bacterium]